MKRVEITYVFDGSAITFRTVYLAKGKDIGMAFRRFYAETAGIRGARPIVKDFKVW